MFAPKILRLSPLRRPPCHVATRSATGRCHPPLDKPSRHTCRLLPTLKSCAFAQEGSSVRAEQGVRVRSQSSLLKISLLPIAVSEVYGHSTMNWIGSLRGRQASSGAASHQSQHHHEDHKNIRRPEPAVDTGWRSAPVRLGGRPASGPRQSFHSRAFGSPGSPGSANAQEARPTTTVWQSDRGGPARKNPHVARTTSVIRCGQPSIATPP